MNAAPHSGRFQLFLLILVAISAGSLLLMNEANTVLSPAETASILAAQAEVSDLGPLPARLLDWIYQWRGLDWFNLRLPGILALVAAAIGWYAMARRLLGESTTVFSLIVLASTWLVINLAKFAVADTWLMTFQLLFFASTLRHLKQNDLLWKILFVLTAFGGFLIHPLAMLIYSWVIVGGLMVLHPQGKRLRNSLVLGTLIIVPTLVGGLGGFGWSTINFQFAYGQAGFGKFLLWQFIGILPWLGFLPAALWDLIQKLRRREELAVILSVFLLSAILSYGLILQMALILLIAKQVGLYFHPNYPYRPVVRTVAVLQVVITCLSLFLLMMGGAIEWRGIGFRSMMVWSVLYWGFSFMAVIGLFSISRRLIIGGITLSGALAVLLFWLQVNPLLENYRNSYRQLAERVAGSEITTPTVALPSALEGEPSLQLYLQAKGWQTVSWPEKAASASAVLLTIEPELPATSTFVLADTITPRPWPGTAPVKYYLLRRNID